MKGASQPSLSQPLAALAPKTASGGKIRARRFAPAWRADKPLYRFGKTHQRAQTRVGARILANTIGNLVADAVAGNGKPKTAQQQAEEKLGGLSDEKKAYLASKGITLEATGDGVRVNGYRDAKQALAADQEAGLIHLGSDNLAMQWKDERTGFVDTTPNRAGVDDLGGVQFSFDTANGRDGFTSDWLTVGDSDALRFFSNGEQTYLYMGGIARYDALGVTARYGNFIYDPPIGDGGFVFNTIFDTVLTGGAGLVPRLGESLLARGVGGVAENGLGRISVSSNLKYGTTLFGQEAHVQAGALLQARLEAQGVRGVIDRTGPGLTGVDMSVPARFSKRLGFEHIEIKPNTASGLRSFNRQVGQWSKKYGYDPASIKAVTYDAQGNLRWGFDF